MEIEATQEEVNKTIGESNFKLNFHREVDNQIMEDGRKKMDEMKAIMTKK